MSLATDPVAAAPEDDVGIAPHKAARLATATRDLGARVEAIALDLRGPLSEVGEELSPLVRLLDVARWLTTEAASLQRLLDDIRDGWVRGAAPPPGVSLWWTPYSPAFDDPEAATRAAARVQALVADVDDPSVAASPEGGATDLDRELERFGDDPVFATLVAGMLDPARVVELLRREAAGRRFGGEGDPVPRRVERLLATLATASRADTLPWDLPTLESAASADGRDSGALLARLFVEPARWGERELEWALHEIVLDRASADVVPSEGTADGSAIVLAAIARQPAVARSLVAALDDAKLGALLESARGAAGGGALVDVLVAATRPVGDRPSAGEEASASMRRIVSWVARHDDPPGALRERLAELVVPYLWSFRPAAAEDDRQAPHPLRGVSVEERDRVLDLAAATPRGQARLRDEGQAWVRAALRAATSGGVDGTRLATIAGIDARVHAALDEGGRLDAAARDDRADRQRFVRDSILSFEADAVVMPGFSAGAAIAAQQLDRHFEPSPAHLTTWDKGARVRQARDQATFEAAYLSAWWAAAAPGVVDRLPPPPACFFRSRFDDVCNAFDRFRPRTDLREDEQAEVGAWLARPEVRAATRWPEAMVGWRR